MRIEKARTKKSGPFGLSASAAKGVSAAHDLEAENGGVRNAAAGAGNGDRIRSSGSVPGNRECEVRTARAGDGRGAEAAGDAGRNTSGGKGNG